MSSFPSFISIAVQLLVSQYILTEYIIANTSTTRTTPHRILNQNVLIVIQSASCTLSLLSLVRFCEVSLILFLLIFCTVSLYNLEVILASAAVQFAFMFQHSTIVLFLLAIVFLSVHNLSSHTEILPSKFLVRYCQALSILFLLMFLVVVLPNSEVTRASSPVQFVFIF